jgi:hypothetical protein
MVQIDDRSPSNQTHVTNTNKNNDRKEKLHKKSNIEDNSREGEDNNENPDVFENEDDNEIRAEMPVDEVEMLKNHIEAQRRRGNQTARADSCNAKIK